MRVALTGFVLMGLSFSLVGCSTESIQTKGNFRKAEKLLNSSLRQSGYRDYVSAFIRSQNDQRIDDNSGCYEFNNGTTVELILTVNSEGIIVDSDTATNTEKAKCFRRAYLNRKMPLPPFVPIAVKLNMR